MRVMTMDIGAHARADVAGIRGRAVTDQAVPAARGPSCGATTARHQWSWSDAVLAAMVATSLVAQCSPTFLAVLQFDRAAIAAGQIWRVITGNLVHYNWAHWVANVGTFAALCWIAAGGGRGILPTVLLSMFAVGTSVFVSSEGVTTYRGISGADCALGAWVLVMLAARERGWTCAGWLAVLLLVMAKSVYEMVTGLVLLPTSAPAGVTVVGVTHVAGLSIGVICAGIGRLSSRLSGSSSGKSKRVASNFTRMRSA